MVHCAVEYGSPCDADFVTFGEFCVLVDELQHHYEIGYVLQSQLIILFIQVKIV